MVQPQSTHALIVQSAEHGRKASLGRAVVDDDNLMIDGTLAQRSAERTFHRSPPVLCGHDDCDLDHVIPFCRVLVCVPFSRMADRSRASGVAIAPRVSANPEPEVGWRTLVPPKGRLRGIGIREFWSNRELIRVLVGRDLKLRYRQTLFGIAWAVLQPLAAMVLFSLIFGSVAHVKSDGIPYPVFVLAGLAIWAPMSSGVLAAAESLVEQRDLVTKVFFPRITAPVSAVLAMGVDLAIGLALVIPVMAAYGVAPGVPLVTLPVWCILGLAVSVGAGLWVSAANVLYRDVRYVLGFLMQLWLFATPVVFPISIVHGLGRYLLALNPATAVVEGTRWALLDGPRPGTWLLISLATLFALLISGVLYFRAVERSFADRI